MFEAGFYPFFLYFLEEFLDVAMRQNYPWTKLTHGLVGREQKISLFHPYNLGFFSFLINFFAHSCI